MDKVFWHIVAIVVISWMIFTGWILYMVMVRPLWMVVPMTYVCQNDGKQCDWKWPTQVLGR